MKFFVIFLAVAFAAVFAVPADTASTTVSNNNSNVNISNNNHNTNVNTNTDDGNCSCPSGNNNDSTNNNSTSSTTESDKDPISQLLDTLINIVKNLIDFVYKVIAGMFIDNRTLPKEIMIIDSKIHKSVNYYYLFIGVLEIEAEYLKDVLKLITLVIRLVEGLLEELTGDALKVLIDPVKDLADQLGSNNTILKNLLKPLTNVLSGI